MLTLAKRGKKKRNRKYFMYCNLAYRPEMRLALRRLSCLQSKRKGFTEKKKESKSRYDVRKRNKVNLPVLV